jgi:hypothetical protein
VVTEDERIVRPVIARALVPDDDEEARRIATDILIDAGPRR